MPLTDWLAGARVRARALLRRDAVEQDFAEEIRFHLEMETEANLRRGMSPEEARRAARLSFGGLERVREDHRDARGTRLLEDALADLRFAARWLLRRPGFALSATLTQRLRLAEGSQVEVGIRADEIVLLEED